jgi:hypothetical protein
MDYIEKDEQQHQDEESNGFWNFTHTYCQSRRSF